MKRWRAFSLVLLQLALFQVCLGPNEASALPQPQEKWVRDAKAFLDEEDYLGFRCYVRRLYGAKINATTWQEIKTLVTVSADQTGYDLIPFWNYRTTEGKSNLDKTLEFADDLMLKKQFDAAFLQYQNIANYLKASILKLETSEDPATVSWRKEARALYPFVLHYMGRALYGAKRFSDAVTVYQWIGSSYPYFRQVLFERMWAAFRTGQVEVALGAIASQKSAYFSSYLPPESYLIQTYLYRKLCRMQELEKVETEMREYQQALDKGVIADWAVNDLASRTLFGLSQVPVNTSDDNAVVSSKSKLREQGFIKAAFSQMFMNAKPNLKKGLETALAYSRLSSTAAGAGPMKPVKAFTAREEYFKLNLEIWPAHDAEDWLDEIGNHQFIGESLCAGGGAS